MADARIDNLLRLGQRRHEPARRRDRDQPVFLPPEHEDRHAEPRKRCNVRKFLLAAASQDRRAAILHLKEEDIAENSREIEALRLEVRSAVLDYGANDARTAEIQAEVAAKTAALEEKGYRVFTGRP